MITIIIAGGSGTRLWPLSTPSIPKHLLTLTDHETLVQQTYNRAKRISEKIYVVTEISHADILKEQLSELDDDAFIIEPGRRNTASCVVAALHHLQSRHSHDEPIVFLSADHFIRNIDGFESSFRRAGSLSAELGREVLVGVEPTYPATGFGYIKKGERLDKDGLAFNVGSFKEKPDLNTAKRFLSSGNYLWNAGYFVGSINTFLGAMEDSAPVLKDEYDRLCNTTTRSEYEEVYLSFINEQIDTALNEKVDNLLVVPAEFDWMDIGSFKDLHDVSDHDEFENTIRGEGIHCVDIENSYIRNEDSSKPVAVIGLDNVVVVNTKDGILVSRKDLSQQVGEIAKKIQ